MRRCVSLLQMFIVSESHYILFLQECISFEAKIGDKTCNFVSFYRSVRQTKVEFKNFIKNSELNVEHTVSKIIFLIIVFR